MLGRLPGRALVSAVVGSMVFAFIARRVWLRSIGHYTSASS
jgi:ABC-2 type transport system permease protein